MWPDPYLDLTADLPLDGPCHNPACDVDDAPLRIDPRYLRGVDEYRHLCDTHYNDLCAEA